MIKILFIFILILLILNLNFTENFAEYWEEHSKDFLNNAQLKYFDYNILKYNVNKENKFITDILLKSPKNSIFLDVGAYNGDTSISIARLLKNKKRNDIKIIAFEPKQNLSNKINNTAKQENLNVKCIETLISNKKGILYKKKEEGAGTIYGTNYKSNPFKCDKLDNILKKNNINKVYFMKIDVEGQEPNVLEGAQNILKNTQHLYIEMWTDKHYTERTGNKNVKYNKIILKHLNSFYPIKKIEKNVYFKNKDLFGK